jgi:hypothetical protein
MIYQRFSQNKHKRKREKSLRETSQGCHVSGIASPSSPGGRFYYLWRKRGFIQKIREVKRTFSILECWDEIGSTLRKFSI